MPMSSTLEGPLSKWTNMIHGWQFRYFVLDQMNGLLSYYTSKENITKGERRGCIRLSNAYVGYDNEDDITFTITVDDKTFHLQASNLDEREKWVSKVERVIRLHSNNNQNLIGGSSKHQKSSKHSNNQHKLANVNYLSSFNLLDDTIENTGDMKQFDSSLAESDAYLQIMIEQLKTLEEKRSNMLTKKQHSDSSTLLTDQKSSTTEVSEASETSNVKSGSINSNTSSLNSNHHPIDNNNEPNQDLNNNEDDLEYNLEALNSIISSTESLIETLKHAIICLQIAKANCDPRNVIDSTEDLKQVLSHFNETNLETTASKTNKLLADSNDANSANTQSQNTKEKKSYDVVLLDASNKANIKDTLNNNNNKQIEEMKNPKQEITKKNKRFIMPMSSYSSSDDENERKHKDNLNDSTKTIKCATSEANLNANEKNQQQRDFEEFYSNIHNDSEDDEFGDLANSNEDNDSESFYDAIDQNMSYSFDLSSNDTSNNIGTNSECHIIPNKQAEQPNESSFTKNNELAGLESSINQLKLQNDKVLVKNPSQFDLIDYDEDLTPDELDINNQQSVITHLLTQVRIGMDLTKITLPTFILEPRSLLEMYADFFAHTDLFLEIPDIKTPRERMVQVVKWYMSTFHAGRKSPVAKKPYNPILGEIFQCWYSVPSPKLTGIDKTVVSNGPVPWATRDQLTFIAEQVSHHPPISAFYAEHYNKRIQLDGYTWTKSKFLGLSVAVQMIGKAVLSLLDHDEEYFLTFPSAYGRSILTVPWFEMGGQVEITCPKTGYCSTIDFLTKPFYGGKKHQIHGSINGPDKKTLYTIDGDWNGTMFIKSGGKTDLLISTQSTPTIKKQVRHITEQYESESRKLWQEVTYYLKTKNIEMATAAKLRIEQKQRDDVKLRKEQNRKYETKYFDEQGENWIYVKPLVKRLQEQGHV